jgi:hypothetical protein
MPRPLCFSASFRRDRSWRAAVDYPPTMKKKSPLLVYVFAALALVTSALFAADAKEVTMSGEGKCAKCAMDEAEKCQNAIEVTQDGKKVVYYLADNQVSKDFHKNLCTSTAKVTATGTVEMKDGKHILTATKIEKSS